MALEQQQSPLLNNVLNSTTFRQKNDNHRGLRSQALTLSLPWAFAFLKRFSGHMPHGLS